MGSAEWHSPIVFMHLHAADVAALFVAMENTTRPSGKLHVCSCPTSLQNFINFTAVVFCTDCCRMADYRSDFRILLFALSMAMVSNEAR